jgi:[protein-PII] uridylyltransferase
VQHEFFHQFTADEHTLKCIEKLDELVTHKEEEEDRFGFFRKLFRDMDDPFIFYLAFLMHDAGRALGTKTHEDASALLALRVSRRWSIAPERRKFLLFLVNNHLVLFRYATQRNIDDPQVLREFIAIVKEPHYLDALYLFSFADSRGTSEQAWTSWKEMSLRRLYDMAKRYLTHGEDWEKSLNISSTELAASVSKLLPQKMSDEIKAHFLFMPRHYFLFRTAERIASHIKLFHLYFAKIAESAGEVEPPHLHWDHREEAGLSKITLVSWDRHLLMAKLAGALASQRINILSADLFRREDDLVLDILQVCDFNFRSVSDHGKIKRIEENVRRAFCDPEYDVEVIVQKCEPSIRNARESTGFDIARQLDISEEASGRYTVVTLQTMDRLGLLYEIFLTFGQMNLEVCHARIATEKGAAADTFYIQDHSERPVKDPQILEILRNKLFALVAK